LRAVLTQLLTAGVGLADALAQLDAFAGRSRTTRAATVAAAVVDLSSGELSYATLGHPAPLVISTGGVPRFLSGTGGAPLGTGADEVPIAEERLAIGDMLVLFSDGLIERPGRSLDEGLAEFARVAGEAAADRLLPAGASAEPVERVCALSVEVLTRTGYTDDVTVIGMQLRDRPPPPFRFTADSTRQLSEMRNALGGWLDGLDVDPEEVGELQLIATEAATNALEHAYGVENGPMILTAELATNGRLCVAVDDLGRWRSPAAAPSDRGRGLSMIRHFSAGGLAVEPRPDGTTVRVEYAVHRNAVLDADPPTPVAVSAESAFGAQIDFEPEIVVRVHGAVDVGTSDAFAAAIGEASRGGTRPVVVDLTETAQLASAGVRVLYEAASAPSGAGGLALRTAPGSPADAVVRLVGLGSLVVDEPG
jgi:anti-sigma regulatory factor (Ser/Thr protein kinase)/anti-anti-sigma regulatory factor